MNKDSTIRLLQGLRYENLAEVERDVIRAERHYEGKPLGIFYFDFTEEITNPKFDLQVYLQKQIASNFYKNEGSLQWNYYLNFVLSQDAFRNFRDTPEATKIEADRTFARKRIWQQETLNADLSQPLAATLQSTKPSQDIASRWVDALTQSGLGRVADSTAEYTQIVKDYLSGESKVRKNTAIKPTTPVSNGRFIQLLHRDSFRTQPKNKDFEFATVNLFRGANGAGKTSLLEAIELCICGGNRRQGGKPPLATKLHLQFSGENQVEQFPGASAADYRARDVAWYGGYYRTGNRLCQNFGRFNFFDSDAASQLSIATNGNEIVGAINALLLGEFATIIEERMRQCLERFAREERTLQQRVQNCRSEATKISQQIEQLKAIKDTRHALFGELKIKANSCRWQKLPGKFKLDELSILRESVEDAAASLSQNTGRLPWLARVSISSLNRESKQLGAALKLLSKQQEFAKSNSTELERIKIRVADLDGELKITKRLLEYHLEPDALSLLGIGNTVKEAKVKVSQLKEASILLRAVDLKQFEKCSITLDEMASQQAADLVKKRRQLTKLKTKAEDLKTQYGTIKSIVEQIKGLGRRFCDLDPLSTDCPLCGASHEQLLAQITSQDFGSSIASSLSVITSEISSEHMIVIELEKGVGDLTQLRRAAQVVFSPSQIATRSTNSVVENLSSLSDKATEEKNKLDELTAKENRLKLSGFEEEELQNLFEAAHENHSLQRSKLIKKEFVHSLVAEQISVFKDLLADEREKRKIQKEIDAELRRIIKQQIESTSIEDGSVELERRKKLLDEVLLDMHSSQKAVLILETDEFSSIANRLEIFAKAIARIQDALKRVEEKDALEQRLADSLTAAQNDLAKSEPRHTRANAALNLLTKLLGSDYKTAYLEQVMAEHKEKISVIFSRIHAPHEFKSVNIDSNVLLERHTGVKSAVCEISTGQRAALALSIFLSLNSSVSLRAPWLLFDDPIVHVDDLNILSFLDMLRDLVILGNRQVFFATANTRIADLFAKKFEFLGNKFRHFQLAR